MHALSPSSASEIAVLVQALPRRVDREEAKEESQVRLEKVRGEEMNIEEMNIADFTPLTGKSLVEMEQSWATYDGRIIIPESIKKRTAFIGRVVKMNRSARDLAWQMRDLTGLRVQLEPGFGVVIDGNYWVVPNLFLRDPNDKKSWDCTFSAILPDDAKVGDGQARTQGDAPRCRFCGPAKASVSDFNMMMVRGEKSGHPYYCPRCRKMENGVSYDSL